MYVAGTPWREEGFWSYVLQCACYWFHMRMLLLLFAHTSVNDWYART
jgi:hypothetical protein